MNTATKSESLFRKSVLSRFRASKRPGTKKRNDAFANRLRLKISSADEHCSRA
jgi:hypothetical protein